MDFFLSLIFLIISSPYVCACDDNLTKQSAIIHPFVKRYIDQHIAQLDSNSFVVIESAILVEAGYRETCNAIVFVTCDINIRRMRLKESRNYSEEKINTIIKKQWNDEQYCSQADYCINNNGDDIFLREQLEKVIEFSL